MNTFSLQDQTKLGLETVMIGGRPTHCATYEGYVITELFKTEHEAILAAQALLTSLNQSPIHGVTGYDLNQDITAFDTITFAQVLRFGKEDYLVVGTAEGAFEVIYESDRRDMYLDEDDIELGMKVYEAISLYAQLLQKNLAKARQLA